MNCEDTRNGVEISLRTAESGPHFAHPLIHSPSTATCCTKLAEITLPRVMTMISADQMCVAQAQSRGLSPVEMGGSVGASAATGSADSAREEP
jgi:hypothetical protein